MIGRRIFSAMGTPKTNMFVHISCITRKPPGRDYHVTLSRNWRVSAMPVGVQLVGARGLDYRNVVAGASHELQAHGKILFGEAAGNGKRWQPAQVADAAQRIGVRESGLEI